jgi:hypothetical protein
MDLWMRMDRIPARGRISGLEWTGYLLEAGSLAEDGQDTC